LVTIAAHVLVVGSNRLHAWGVARPALGDKHRAGPESPVKEGNPGLAVPPDSPEAIAVPPSCGLRPYEADPASR